MGLSCSSSSLVSSRPLFWRWLPVSMTVVPTLWVSSADRCKPLELLVDTPSALGNSTVRDFLLPSAFSTCLARYSSFLFFASSVWLLYLSSSIKHFRIRSRHWGACARLMNLGSLRCMPIHLLHLNPCLVSSVYLYFLRYSSLTRKSRGTTSGMFGATSSASSPGGSSSTTFPPGSCDATS